MMKLFRFVVLLFVVTACSKLNPHPKGIATWDEVRSLADAFVLNGDTNNIFNHTDLTGVPLPKAQKIKSILGNWHGIPSNFKLMDTKVVTFNEFETLQREYYKDLPEDMRNALLSGIRWNIKPEKIIVFSFVGSEPNSTNASNQFSVGAYQTNGLWYFSASYNED